MSVRDYRAGLSASIQEAASQVNESRCLAWIPLELSPKGSGNVADHWKGHAMPDSAITQRLASLRHLSKPALCGLWQQLFKEPPSQMRKDLMFRIVAHRLQEQEFGGLSDATSVRPDSKATFE